MTHAFAALSVKRNRSTSTSRTYGLPAEPGKKFSKLIAKITNSIIVVRHDSKRAVYNHQRQGLFQYFKNDNTMDTLARNPCLRSGHTFASDDLYEHNHYKRATPSQIKLDLKQHRPRAEHDDTSTRSTCSISDAEKSNLPSILVKSAPETHDRSHPPPRNMTNHIRHHSHVSHLSSSNVTTHSEDLTAKEFADIAGIRILPDTDDGIMWTVSTRSSHYLRDPATRQDTNHDNDVDDDDDDDEDDDAAHHDNRAELISSCHSTYSSMHSQDCRKPRIWDSEFWQNPDHPPGAMHTTPFDKQPSYPASNTHLAPPILHELRRMSTRSSERLSNHDAQPPRPCVIKKGRFEIHLETHTPELVPAVSNRTSCTHSPAMEGPCKAKDRHGPAGTMHIPLVSP